MGTELLTFHVFLSKRIDDSVLCRSSFYDMLPLWPLHFPSFIALLRTIKFEYKKKSFPFQSPRHKRVTEAWRYSALCLKTVTKSFQNKLFVLEHLSICSAQLVTDLRWNGSTFHIPSRELAGVVPELFLGLLSNSNKTPKLLIVFLCKWWRFWDGTTWMCAEIFFWWASRQRFVMVRVADDTSLEGRDRSFNVRPLNM